MAKRQPTKSRLGLEKSIPYPLIIGLLALLIVILAIVFWAINNSSNGAGSKNGANSNLVNINTATREELIAVTGIGQKTADRIIERRQKKPFTKIVEMLSVQGVTMPNFELMKTKITAD